MTTSRTRRAPHPQRKTALGVYGWAAAAAVVAGILVAALYLPGLGAAGGPGESAGASPVASPSTSASSTTVRIGGVEVSYDEPPGWQLRVQAENRVVGFADGPDDQPAPLSYGYIGRELHPEARGVVIADPTRLEFHANDQPPLADSAAELLENMANLNMGSASQPSYEVGEVEPTELAGWPALTARVRAITGYPLFEGPGPGGHPPLNLGSAQRVIVADVGDAIVLVQIWAFDEGRLAEWLPRAQELLGTLTLVPAD